MVSIVLAMNFARLNVIQGILCKAIDMQLVEQMDSGTDSLGYAEVRRLLDLNLLSTRRISAPS